MRRLLLWLAAVLVTATVVTACRQYLPVNRYLQPRQVSETARGTSEARHAFDHAKHTKPFATANVTCLYCHRFDMLIETPNDELARALSGRALYPGSAACHACHRAGELHVAQAPSACTTCHENLQPLKPDDHEVAWLKVHSSMARANPARCEGCHRQSFCIDCHAQRDTIQTRVHERNFRFFHSVQVRANPMQCGSCHREDFCLNCHQAGKVP